jgi:hypothetical protein
MDNLLIHAICNANDQGHRAAHHNDKHPIENVYTETDYGGATHAAWQIGYDKERRYIAQMDEWFSGDPSPRRPAMKG